MKRLIQAAIIAASALLAAPAAAFCGFYVSSADAQLYNDATRVSLMRDGKRTVLAMQNNYEGPAEDFAMVVPVPVVLQEEDVKTLENEVFHRLDVLTSPRLVEYREKDPCDKPYSADGPAGIATGGGRGFGRVGGLGAVGTAGSVSVEAKFEVGEYDITILSSSESTALEDWLDDHNYNIPDGAAAYFKPYVQQGQYFFVARVDVDKVQYKEGRALLSPLRFHYESDDFVLPVRLGLINAKDAQDLIVYILAKGQRYEVANLPNVTIPTNIPVASRTREHFHTFYRELFNHVLKDHPQAVVTEYSWNAGKCDPCPTRALKREEIYSLGADVLAKARAGKDQDTRMNRAFRGAFLARDWTLTRLHTRYARTSLGEDLVFQAAPAIEGGNGMPQGKNGSMPTNGASSAKRNRFQGRYIIRHFWEGAVECDNPSHGRWRDSKGERAAGSMNFGPLLSAAAGQEPEEDDPNSLSSFVDASGRYDGLERKIEDYDEPAGDPVESWGELVDPPKEASESDEEEPEASPEEMAGGQKLDGRERPQTSSGCHGNSSAGVIVLVLLGLGLRRRFELASSGRLG